MGKQNRGDATRFIVNCNGKGKHENVNTKTRNYKKKLKFAPRLPRRMNSNKNHLDRPLSTLTDFTENGILHFALI